MLNFPIRASGLEFEETKKSINAAIQFSEDTLVDRALQLAFHKLTVFPPKVNDFPEEAAGRVVDELYPEVVDGHEKEGGVPSRLLKTDRPEGRERKAPPWELFAGFRSGSRTTSRLRSTSSRVIAMALEAEVAGYIERFADERDEDGRRLVVRNGRAEERRVTVGSGTVAIRAPRVHDKRADPETGERQRFSSRILPAYARRSPKVTEVLPILYLRGLATGDFGPALRDLLGEDASGLSASSIQRLTEACQAERDAFSQRRLEFHR